ncbi:hypothetical protein EVAR_805_1 [Eumeta japonica]|uniref:Ig-like domain-containing protein n=1 Tax=Eumeta variegata TaxID=151549 RepID=A0A4C1SCF4_EUMVA|nr:hypothetical protein EVAR_805_1 [Eumeta japonica]
MEVGPENAVYCRLENPNGVVFFDGFGRCKLNLDRVNALHNGQWWMMVGLPEKVRVEMFLLQIEVVQKELKSQVQMSVAMSKDDPSLTVSCSVETSSAPRVCKFRDPQGQILIAQEGVGEGRYTFQGTGVSTNGTDKHVMDCGLRISSPTTDDLGIWRCAIETESDVYYGFHLVICPWLVVSGSLPPSVVTEPTLASRTTVLSAMAGDDTQMMCTIPAGIRYCYFRSNNGTVFTVLPSESNAGFDYVGNGFEAGECGIRLKHISVSDFGRWTCHVGVTVDGVLTELSTFIMVSVQELFVANLFRSTNGELGVFAMVNAGAADLEYCRFVRGDGRGFTNEVLPYGYEFNDVLHQQRCELRILRPTAVDFQSWTVAVKIRGQQNELLVNTRDLINTCSSSYSTFFVIRLTLLCICMALLCLSLGLLFSSEEKRRWTYVRITAVRDSVRRSFSFRKPPPVVPPADTNATTSQAA